jgi:hypothetical protein
MKLLAVGSLNMLVGRKDGFALIVDTRRLTSSMRAIDPRLAISANDANVSLQ